MQISFNLAKIKIAFLYFGEVLSDFKLRYYFLYCNGYLLRECLQTSHDSRGKLRSLKYGILYYIIYMILGYYLKKVIAQQY